ncbi:hypothetical protein MUP01_06710 [Candidatus Bathyarchaeota archaeon]|nr:hypothetical protein [Candidatus Bathyarchaeota archaeon]
MHAGLSRIEGDRAESARSYVLSAVLATTVGQLFGLAFPSIAWTPFFVFMVMLPYLGASTYHIYLAKKKMKKNKEDKRTTSEPQKRVNRDEKTS